MKAVFKFKKDKSGNVIIEDRREGFKDSSEVAVSIWLIYFLLWELKDKGMDINTVIDDILDTFYFEEKEKIDTEVERLIKGFVERGMLNDFVNLRRKSK